MYVQHVRDECIVSSVRDVCNGRSQHGLGQTEIFDSASSLRVSCQRLHEL